MVQSPLASISAPRRSRATSDTIRGTASSTAARAAALISVPKFSDASTGLGSQPTRIGRPTRAQGRGQAQHPGRVEVVRLDENAVASLGRIVQGELNDVECSWSAAPRGRIDQDDRLGGVEQGIGQVEAPDAEIDDAHPFGQLDPRQAAGNLDAERIVAQEDVTDAGDQDTARRHDPSGKPTSSEETFNSSFRLIAPRRAVTGLMWKSDIQSEKPATS